MIKNTHEIHENLRLLESISDWQLKVLINESRMLTTKDDLILKGMYEFWKFFNIEYLLIKKECRKGKWPIRAFSMTEKRLGDPTVMQVIKSDMRLELITMIKKINIRECE